MTRHWGAPSKHTTWPSHHVQMHLGDAFEISGRVAELQSDAAGGFLFRARLQKLGFWETNPP